VKKKQHITINVGRFSRSGDSFANMQILGTRAVLRELVMVGGQSNRAYASSEAVRFS
jgi:hypothetical protein